MKTKILSLTLCACLLTACAPSPSKLELSSQEQTNPKTEIAETAETAKANGGSYAISLYTDASNKNSSIQIEYPVFAGDNYDELNRLIYDRVQSFAQIDHDYFPEDTGLHTAYQSAVTLQNSKIVSIIFWGTSEIEGNAYETSDLFTLNVDLQTMKELTLKDLYSTEEAFAEVFFDKAFYPSNPTVTYDEASFAEMKNLQSPEYQTVSPFSMEGNVICFLQPDGIVLSMPSAHATGGDYFEAQLNYSDIQPFYLPQQNYWEN